MCRKGVWNKLGSSNINSMVHLVKVDTKLILDTFFLRCCTWVHSSLGIHLLHHKFFLLFLISSRLSSIVLIIFRCKRRADANALRWRVDLFAGRISCSICARFCHKLDYPLKSFIVVLLSSPDQLQS